ncbi:MAG: chorismate mutase [Sphingosinicella sp.]|nr:chorismate mutase [Sphingosinicella sp.]
MTDQRISPQECRTMTEVRHGVDEVDRQIIALLGERFRYMEAAARIKPSREMVRDEARKADVLEKVRRSAEGAGVDVRLAEGLYETLVEASIDFELRRFDAIN